MTIVSIHQPGYIPWLGFFKKILHADIFVFLDDVLYAKRNWHNRNKIRTSKGSIWLSVPIKSNSGSKLNEIEIDNSTDWARVHKKTINYNYSKASFFYEYSKFIEELFGKKFDLLIDINLEIIRFLMNSFKITTKTVFSSELMITERGSERNLSICKKLGANIYLSGITGKDYLNVKEFKKNSIKLQFQNFQHPTYKQCYEPFIPNMAAIDLLFNEGKNAFNILKNAKNF